MDRPLLPVAGQEVRITIRCVRNTYEYFFIDCKPGANLCTQNFSMYILRRSGLAHWFVSLPVGFLTILALDVWINCSPSSEGISARNIRCTNRPHHSRCMAGQGDRVGTPSFRTSCMLALDLWGKTLRSGARREGKHQRWVGVNITIEESRQSSRVSTTFNSPAFDLVCSINQ